MIIHYRETTHGHCEDIREFLEPVFQPFLAFVVSFTQQERAADATRHAVIPAGQGQIDQFARAIAIVESPGGLAVLYAISVLPSRSIALPVAKN